MEKIDDRFQSKLSKEFWEVLGISANNPVIDILEGMENDIIWRVKRVVLHAIKTSLT